MKEAAEYPGSHRQPVSATAESVCSWDVPQARKNQAIVPPRWQQKPGGVGRDEEEERQPEPLWSGGKLQANVHPPPRSLEGKRPK